MRLTLVHQLVFAALLASGIVVGHRLPVDPSRGAILGPLCGVALVLALMGPILRWLCVWPLVPKCPRCGVWVQGFHRGAGPEGLLLVAAPCGHLFVFRGAWVAAPLRLPPLLQAKVAEELGWAAGSDGRVFRLRSDYAATLLDEHGEEVGRRRARWPYWLVRWTAD